MKGIKWMMMSKKKTNRIAKIEIFDIIIFSIIMIFWGYICYMFAPGIMTSDSIDQWNQVQSGVFSDIHSPLHTIIEWSISKIWNSTIAICIFQIVFFAILWTIVCKKLRNNNKVIGIFEIIGTVLISIMPINYMYAVTLWKDVLYSYIILELILLLYIGIKQDFKYTMIQNIFLGFTLICTMKLRHNGLIIGLILIPIILIEIWKNTKSKKKIIEFVSCFFVFFVIIKVVLSSFTIVESATAMNKKWLSIYKVGILYQNGAIDKEEDIEILNDIMPLELWDKYTWDYTMNGLVFSLDMDYNKVNKHKDELWDMMIKYSLKNPKIMFKHYLKLNSVIWQLDEPKNAYTSIIQSTTYIKDGEQAHRSDRNYMKIANKVDKLVNDYKILFRPAIYMYASIIITILLVIITKKKKYFIILIPMLANALSLIPAMTGQDVRYLYCNFLTFYFIVFSIFDVIRSMNIEKIKSAQKENECKKLNKDELKVLVIVPAYNEEGAIRTTIEEILEKNENCDVLVVNDSSKDNTLDEIRKTTANFVSLTNNLGIGGAVQTGYKYAYENGYDVAIQVDGDGQHDPKYIDNLVEEIANGNNMVIGSRFIDKTQYKQTFMRMLGINLTSEIIEMFTNKRIYDTTSGFRAVDKKIIEEFAKDYPYDYPEPTTTMKLILKGKKIKEVRVEMRQRATGKSSISPFKSIGYMIKVTLSLMLLGIKKL